MKSTVESFHMTFQIKSYLQTIKDRVDKELQHHISALCKSDRIRQPVSYAVEAGGKRVRPALCLSAFSAISSSDNSQALPIACALEMIHTYSLIHDDLPALDNDDLRRGKPTCHVQFDEATAILAGDALLTMAFEVLTKAGMDADNDSGRLWLHITHVIANAAGSLGMVEGQARDLAFEGIKLDQAALEDLHRHKTGAMIRASVLSGGLLANGNPEQLDNLASYAEKIGLTFQVVDDILNVTGDPKLLGKAVGTDSQRMKNTYPSLLGLKASEDYARSLIDKANEAISSFDDKADPLRAIARFIVDRKF